jgi:hypothetical protein
MFDAIDKQWQMSYGVNGMGTPANNQTQSGTNEQEMNWGDLGFSGDPNDFNQSGGLNSQFLKNLGWTGDSPYYRSQGYGDSGIGAGEGYTPEFQQFLRDKGITFQHRDDGMDGMALQGFGPDGQPIGTELRNKKATDSQFAVAAALAAGGFGAASLAGMGAANLGAANGAWDAVGGMTAAENAAYGAGTLGGAPTSAAIGYNAPTAVGGVSSVSPEVAMSGMDMAADAGMAASGFGGAPAGGGMMSSIGDAASGIGSWMQQNPGLVNMGGSLANGLIGAYTGNKALDRQQDATAQANALWEPYRQFGVENLGRANGLLRNPSSINQDPQHQFLLQQGTQARDRSAASRGNLYSGAQLKGAERFGQDLGNTSFDRILGRYTGAAQLGATGTTNISNNLTNLGQAGAGAAMYQGNVANNAINNGLGQYNWSQYTNDLKKYPG